eukprot:87425_1
MLARDLVSLLAVIFVTFIFVATMETYCYLVEGLGKTQHYEEIDEILSTYNFDYFIFNNLKDLTTEQIFFVNNVSNQEFITLSENISEISNDIQFIKCDYDNKIDKKIFVQQSGLTLFTTVFRKTIYETISVDTNSAYGDLLQILDRTTPYFEEIITASDIYFILFDENNNSLQFGPKITESNFSFIAQLASTLPTLHIAIYIDNEFAIDKFKEIASQRSIICAAQNGGMIKIQDDDGNCFLRAIAYLLFGDAKFHYLIRYEMIVVYLYKYKQLLKLVDNENIIRSKIPVSFTNNHLSTKQCLIDYGNNITPLGRWTGSYIDAFVVGHLYGINIGNYTFSRFAGGGQGALLYECLKMDDKLDDKYTEICLLVTATSQYHKWRYRNFVHYDAFEKEPIVWSPPITAINSHSILNKYKNNPPLIFSPSPYYILLLNACCVCGKQTVHNCQFPNCDIIICNECGGWPEHPSLLFCPRHSQSHGKSYIESLDKDDSKSISESLQLFGASDDAVFGIESLGRDDNKIISESLQLFGASDDAVFGIESLGRDDNKIISESLQLFGASDDAVIGIESLDKDDNKIIYESIQLFGDEVADEEPKSESPNGCCVCGKQSVHNCQFANCYINICNECGGWPEHPSLLFCPRHSQSHGKSCIESLDKDDSKSISESLQLFGASDDAVIGNEVADEESKSEPEKIPIKQNEFNFGFKVDLWAKLEKAGDGAIDDNSILDPILWDEFVADYPHFIENKTDKKFSSKGIRYLRRKVRKWSAAKKKKTTQLNYLTIGKNGKRNAGAGAKAGVSAYHNFLIYKSFNNLCFDRNVCMTSDDLSIFYCNMLQELKCYHIKNISGDANPNNLIEINVNDYLIQRFKKENNIIKIKSELKTRYNLDVVMVGHTINLCKAFTLRRIFPNVIEYVGHHDQVNMFYGRDVRYLYTTLFAASVFGKNKRQNHNKTFTSIPTIYDYFKKRLIEFGPTINIFESAAQNNDFSSNYTKALRKVGLRPGLDQENMVYNDVSYNAWQQLANMRASNEVLKRRKGGIMTTDEWCHYKNVEFRQNLVKNNIFPLLNVKCASGITGLLDLYPNKHVHEEYRKERKILELKHPDKIMTLTGNFKCLPREYLSLAVKNGMKNVTTNKTYLKTYKQYSSYLGYTASLSDLDDGKDTFMRHAVKSMHQDVVKEHRCLDRLKKNPLKCKSLEIKKLKSIPGRKVSDIGKITTRYSEKELPAIKAIFDIKDKNENQIKNIFGDLLILAKKASVHSFEQIIKESNLIDNYDDTKLPFRTKWDILNLTDNYNYLGLFNFMKSPTDTQNECIEPPSFIMKYSAEESQEETKKSIQKKKKKRGSSFNTPSKKEIVREQK